MYYIGIDGGGSKTEGILCDGKGHILAREVQGGSNPNDIGIAAAADMFASLAAVLCQRGGVEHTHAAIFVGGSGCGVADTSEQITQVLKERFLHVCVGSDIINVAVAGLGDAPGIAVIAGTGSAFVAWDGNTPRLFGGNGFLFEEKGSGFTLARDGIAASLREEDGLDAPTQITVLLQQKLGKRVKTAVGDFHHGGKAYIASYAPIVFEASRQDDPTARRLVESHACYIAHTVKQLLALTGLPSRVALSGGLFQNTSFLKAVTCFMGEKIAATRVSLPQVYGALRRAVQLMGEPCADAFQAQFQSEYERILRQ